MPPTIGWTDIVIRLAFTIGASALIGINRGEHGRAAGFRTVMLVSLAAAISMIQANLLMNTVGKQPDSFIVLDLMRLPLGILSGMGFIGAGAILRKGKLIVGVTTAATLWFVTVMGLCFGGGQLGLGVAAMVLGIFVLWALERFDEMLVRDRRMILIVTTSADGPTDAAIRERLRSAPLRVVSYAWTTTAETQACQLRYELNWRARSNDTEMPAAVRHVAEQPGVLQLQWKP